MVIGPNLTELVEHAKQAIMRYYVDKAQADGTPPTLRAMYVRKAEQAQLVVDGGQSELIEGEAAVRGITPLQMAQVILQMAPQGGDQIEIDRIKANVAVENAANETAILKVLSDLGIPFGIDQTPIN